jgi:hypothetical protein
LDKVASREFHMSLLKESDGEGKERIARAKNGSVGKMSWILTSKEGLRGAEMELRRCIRLMK